MNLEDLASSRNRAGQSRAALPAAECTVSEGEQFSANVRMGEMESLKEAGSRGAGVRVLVGKHTGSAYTSDLTDEGIAQMVNSALELAKITTEDPYAGLPDQSELGKINDDLALLLAVGPRSRRPSTKIEWAKRAEAAAMSADPRITNSEGASCRHARWDDGIRQFTRIPRQLSNQQLLHLSRACRESRTGQWSAISGSVLRVALTASRIPKMSAAKRRSALFAVWALAK